MIGAIPCDKRDVNGENKVLDNKDITFNYRHTVHGKHTRHCICYITSILYLIAYICALHMDVRILSCVRTFLKARMYDYTREKAGH